MSADDTNATDTSSCCASCGIAQVDDIKLKQCDRCDLVKYCSDECQAEHKSQHEEACKKRAAELRDELLFKQPESRNCPICCLPLPPNFQKSTMYECCSKCICDGCCYANVIREKEMKVKKRSLKHSCPFCRTTVEDAKKRWMKRLEANDPMTLFHEGVTQHEKGNYIRAFDYFTKAAELGLAGAHYKLGCMHLFAEGVEKDEGKGKYHLEEASIGGHEQARYHLGYLENSNDNIERAINHWFIAAAQGEAHSIEMLMEAFKQGILAKEDLASALRANQAAVDATKSPQRKAAEESGLFN